MNAGYLSSVLMVISLILFASGWKNVIIRGITHQSLLLFFIFWLLCSLGSWSWNGVHYSGIVGLLLITSGIAIARASGAMLRLHVISVGLLLGSVSFFLKESLHLIPSIIVYSTTVTISGIIGLLAAVTLRQSALQIAAVSIGLLIGDGMFAYSHKEHVQMSMGGAAFQDLWWMTMFMTRTLSMAVLSMLEGFKRAAGFVWETIRNRRE
ncbi:hypothetical protein [Paenibacillus cremeus]|uniref:DUF4203 domain-containing protein n=1 Tax=Paenibacillus cremeus TaxID=2163881 RepID=A0A559KHI9_9BACL|nr:hypothetical protein [Paenibacillus cremeus]TVY11594.1 hypothetical protein FPZ49_02510 [Paenibacillus cremeus]